jgi:hypothetical protein
MFENSAEENIWTQAACIAVIRKPEGKNHVGELGIDVGMLLKWIMKWL